MIRHAVITGATGPLGIALARRLLDRGAAVTALCRPAARRIAWLPASDRLRILECDLRDLAALAGRKDFAPADAFFHLAWNAAKSVSSDPAAQAVSVAHAADAARLAHRLGCGVFVGAGSQSECGPQAGTIAADTPPDPRSPYASAKNAARQLTRQMCESFGLRHNWARILSLYGPGDADDTAIMYCIRTLLRGQRPALTPGEQRWDYLYAPDAADAMWAIAERGADGVAYPLGSGVERPLREYFEVLRDAIDPSLPLGIGEKPYAPGQVMRLCADLTDLTRDTGFVPHYAFADGIAETVAWARANP